MVNTIYQSKSSLICSGYMEKISQNSTFLSAMGAYCILNNIEIEYEENDLDIEDMSPADQGPVRAYLKEIGTIPLLTVEQEKDVCARMAGGDKKARDKLASRIYVHKKRIRIFLENYYKPTLDLNNEKVSSLISVESSQDEVKQDLEDRHPSLEMEFHASQEVPKNFLKLISISSNVEMFQSLTIQEATIVMLNLGYFNQKKYSIESIANFFEIEQEVVLEIMKKYWILYNRWCNAILEQMLTASLELKLKSPKNKL